MPIRFRCTNCSRLLGIARRKAGTQIRCPQCNRPVTVPIQDDGDDLSDLDKFLNSNPQSNGAVPQGASQHAPAVPVLDLPGPETARAAVPATAPQPPATEEARPQPRRRAADEPLLAEDVDELLGIGRQQERLELDEEPSPRAKPVSGMDANSLDDGSGKIVLSPQKATLIVVAVVVLMGLAFTAGFLISPRLG